jgi:hypothetical protein
MNVGCFVVVILLSTNRWTETCWAVVVEMVLVFCTVIRRCKGYTARLAGAGSILRFSDRQGRHG